MTSRIPPPCLYNLYEEGADVELPEDQIQNQGDVKGMVVETAFGELTVFDSLDPKALSFEGLL